MYNYKLYLLILAFIQSIDLIHSLYLLFAMVGIYYNLLIHSPPDRHVCCLQFY